MLKSLSFIAMFCSLIETCTAQTNRVQSPADAVGYLQKYGHAPAGPSQSVDLSTAIMYFQEMANLNITGVLDNDTLAIMNLPRCGMPDSDGHPEQGRRKRYALEGTSWKTDILQYYFVNFTQDLPQSTIRSVFQEAFKYWTDVSPLVLSETQNSNAANINIRFAINDHGDGYPFDGRGGVLAHTFYPTVGNTHYDDSETWTDKTFFGTNLLQVATHELGHAFGLAHSTDPQSVMQPFYTGYNPNFVLGQDDITAIQYLYGKPAGAATTTTTTIKTTKITTTVQPNNNPGKSPVVASSTTTTLPTTTTPQYTQPWCRNSSIDSVTVYNQMTYVFKGSMFAVVTRNGVNSDYKIQHGYPQLINSFWQGAPDNVDATIYLNPIYDSTNTFIVEAGHFFIFKGSVFWRYTNGGQLDSGYPQLIRNGFPGVPNNLDAAFIWSGNGKIYFIQGTSYYRYTRKRGVDLGYPRPLSIWTDLPSHVDAAFLDTTPATYFFSGQNSYLFNDYYFQVKSTTPTAQFLFGCNSISGAIVDANGRTNAASRTISTVEIRLLLLLSSFIFLSQSQIHSRIRIAL